MRRFGQIIHVKPEKLVYYKELHANPWPEIVEAVYKCGIRRVYIYRYGRQLFMFFEANDDFDMERDLQKCVASPKTRQWDEITRVMQEPVAGAPKDAKWVRMKEVHAIEDGVVLEPGGENV